MKRKPLILAMIPCEDVTHETPLGPATIHKAIWNIAQKKFPHTFSQFKVYIAMTEIHESTTLKLRLGPADPEKQGYVIHVKDLKTPTPLDPFEVVVDMKGWRVDAPGEWALDLFWEGEILLSRRLLVSVIA